jgi:hypothetical protein
VEKYLMKFGYLPQSDLETGAQRTEQQMRNAVKNLQVNPSLLSLARYPGTDFLIFCRKSYHKIGFFT